MTNFHGDEAKKNFSGTNAFFVFFACFGAYVGQSHRHIGWAKSMPFASFNPTNRRTNPWNFGGICSAFDEVEKLSFFESAILNFFCFIPMKISHKLHVRVDGTQFLLLWWFTAKNKGGNHKWAWVYMICSQEARQNQYFETFWPLYYFQQRIAYFRHTINPIWQGLVPQRTNFYKAQLSI